jgi:sec-independent protein translocase protein TatA
MLAFYAPGPMEIVIFSIIAVLLFGNRLPGVARSIGSSFVQFKKGLYDVQDEIKETTDATKQATTLDLDNGRQRDRSARKS